MPKPMKLADNPNGHTQSSVESALDEYKTKIINDHAFQITQSENAVAELENIAAQLDQNNPEQLVIYNKLQAKINKAIARINQMTAKTFNQYIFVLYPRLARVLVDDGSVNTQWQNLLNQRVQGTFTKINGLKHDNHDVYIYWSYDGDVKEALIFTSDAILNNIGLQPQANAAEIAEFNAAKASNPNIDKLDHVMVMSESLSKDKEEK